MSNFELPAYGWAPRTDQVRIWNRIMHQDFRRGTIVAHRRWGKDEVGLQATAVKAMQRVGSYWYCLPEYEQARKAIWEMVNWRTKRTRIDDAFPPEIVVRKDDQSMHLTLESGSTVQLIGSDRIDSLVGGGQIGIVLSEAAISDPRAMAFFQPILEESGGWSLEISTVRGKNHFYRSYLAAKEDMDAGDPGVLAALFRAYDTSVFSRDQIERIRKDYHRKWGFNEGDSLFRQEYLCDWDASVVGAVWGQELTEMWADNRVTSAPHDRRLPVFTSWDLGVGDPTAILFFQERFGRHILIDGFEADNIGLDHYVQVLKDKRAQFGYSYAEHYGPHDIQNREWARGLSRMDEAKRYGLHFKRTPNTRLKTQLAAAALLIRNMVVNADSPGAMAAYEHFKGYHFPASKSGEVITTPKHDEHSHSSSALCTYALNVARKLGMHSIDDPELNGEHDDLGGMGKFDPRQFGAAPFGHANSVSNMMRPNNPRRGAFG